MSSHSPALRRSAQGRVLGPPPLPHEHGAWVILYAPLVIALGAAGSFSPVPALLLILAVTGLFLARHAAGLWMRKRGGEGVRFWLGLYSALAVAGALPLFLVYRCEALLQVGLLAALLFGLHSLLLLVPSRKRLDRSQWGELLAVGALTLTAPAAWAVARGRLDGIAWCLWASCALYFASSIFSVKMLLSAVKVKGAFGWPERWRLGRDTFLYHSLMLVIVAFVAARIGGVAAVLTIIAYLPTLVRAFGDWATLTNKLTPLTRVGIRETLLALWFSGFFLAALRMHP